MFALKQLFTPVVSRSAQASVIVPRVLGGYTDSTVVRSYAKKAKASNVSGRSKKKRRGLQPNLTQIAEDLASTDAKQPTVFTPKALKTDLLRTLELEEISKRTAERKVPTFFPGSILRITHKDSLSAQYPRKSVGICIAKRNKGLGSNFVIRNVIEGVGFSQQFDTYSPLIENIEVVELARRRRAKLYYLKDKALKQSTFKYDMQTLPTSGKKVPIRRPK